jgi:hypothetical protein
MGDEMARDLPWKLFPIVDVHDHIPDEDTVPPFFGYAPAETSVQIVHCPDCGRPVSAAHLRFHRTAHLPQKQGIPCEQNRYHFLPNSGLFPVTPTAASKRQSFIFRGYFK